MRDPPYANMFGVDPVNPHFPAHVSREGMLVFSNGRWAETMVQELLDYFGPDHRRDAQMQPRLRLEEYPDGLIRSVLANETSHQLLEMAHPGTGANIQ